jgi:hypothetical protein
MMLYTNYVQMQNFELPITSPTCSTSTSANSSHSSGKNLKFKKDALEFVDYAKEYQTDPKYKTELCKSFTETSFCAYGNKCRFAHGRNELFDKIVNCKKYKQKECLSFFKNKYCCYGSRCHFKHEERKLPQIERSFYTNSLSIYNHLSEGEIFKMTEEELNSFNPKNKRLAVFRKDNNKVISTMKYLNQLENYNEQPKFTLSYNTNLLPMF